MLFEADDMDVFFDPDLGALDAVHTPAAGGPPQAGRVILDQPGAEVFGGAVIVDAPSIRYPLAQFPDLRRGDRITIGNTEYTVRDAPMPVADGIEAVASLSCT